MADKNGNKTGGRKPGVPNKRTSELIDKAKEMGVDPKEFLLKILKGDIRELGYEDRVIVRQRHYDIRREEYEADKAASKDPSKVKPFPELRELSPEEAYELNLVSLDERKEVALELLPYFCPKRKPVDGDGDDSELPAGIQIIITKDDANL